MFSNDLTDFLKIELKNEISIHKSIINLSSHVLY